MIKIPVEKIIEKISEKTDLSNSEIKSKIDSKLKQLSGLISEEGAAHIVANELGVKVLEDPKNLKIKDILPGMRNVDISGKIVNIYEVREFNTNNRSGKVGSFLIGDETGMLRVVCWNDKTDLMTNLNKDAVVKIENGYARENNMGRKEVHLGDKSNLVLNPEGVNVGDVKQFDKPVRKKISELDEAENNIEIMGTIVQVFDPKFFTVDPKSGKRVVEKNGSFYLNDQPIENIGYSYVTNLFLDDGTENIRVVCWKNQTQRLFNKSDEEILAQKDSSFEDIKTDLLGNIVKFIGRTTKNEMFDRIEFIPNLVITDPDPKEELERLEKEEKDTSQTEKISEIQKEESISLNNESQSKVDKTPSAEESDEKASQNESREEDTMPKPTGHETSTPTEEKKVESEEEINEKKEVKDSKEEVKPDSSESEEDILSLDDLEELDELEEE